ncbi:methionine aminopeptidase [candidate division BRC1 bacterium SM23_51]|nr:MAG: methionine aminopeptidase [candidate division BRC1 bacterium SM23_51]
MVEYSAKEVEAIRAAGRLLSRVLDEIGQMVRPGITTAALDRRARELIEQGGAKPAFPEVRDYPATLCTSINEQVVHGIPSDQPLREGAIVGVDCGLSMDGFYADKAVTCAVGRISPQARRLIEVAQSALEAAIAQIHEGAHLGDVSAAIQKTAESAGMSVVRDYTGHGIGRHLHEEPQIPNRGTPGRGPRLRRGMILALEPMVNLGTWQVETLADNWTVVTLDRQLSAHFEHTVAVTRDGADILTL